MVIATVYCMQLVGSRALQGCLDRTLTKNFAADRIVDINCCGKPTGIIFIRRGIFTLLSNIA